VIVTVPIVSLFCSPLEVKAVEPEPPVNTAPAALVTLLAVIVNERAVMSAVLVG